jgi:hypothetical protein
VAQVFLGDLAWARTLRDLHRALVPGGTLAFESRHPGARRWEQWTRAATLRTVDSPDGPVDFWHETVDVSLPLVTYDTFARNQRTGEQTSDRDVLAFRDPATLLRSLHDAGFSVSEQYGDWQRTPLTPESPEIIIVAAKTDEFRG